MKKINEFIEKIGSINRYSLLSRLHSDCLYYIGFGNGNSRLWGLTVDNHIRYMKYLWLLFPINDKPQWLSMKEILNIENQIKKSDSINSLHLNRCGHNKIRL